MNPRIILVTGSNGAIGQAIAQAFLKESPANLVWLGVHHRRDRAEALAAQFPDRVQTIAIEVTQPASWNEAMDRIGKDHPCLDVLVNNAGCHEDALLALMAPESWNRVRATNLDGVFHGCQAVVPRMVAQRSGRIVNIASLSALLSPAGQTNYAAAKAGVVALTQSLAKEVARLGITVNAVCPGYIANDWFDGLGSEEKEDVRRNIPMRRIGQPEDVAHAVKFLACADAAYITGSVLKVDGGIF